MKILLMIGFLALTSCSSLITRSELNSCQKKCSGHVQKLSKDDGKVNCQCAVETTKAEECRDCGDEHVGCAY